MSLARAFLLGVTLVAGACGGRARSAVHWEERAPFKRGTALEHVPAECAGGQLFVDLPAVEGNEAARAAVDVLAGRFFAGMAATPTDRRVLGVLGQALRDEGLDPAHDTKEIALCFRGPAGMVGVFAGDYSGKDVFRAFERAAKKLGDKPPKIEERNGIEYVRLGQLRVARVAPNVIAIGEDTSALVMLGERNDRAEQWGYRAGYVGFARLGGAEPMFLAFAGRGEDVEIELMFRATKTGPELEARRDGVADRLLETPLKDLAPAARSAKIEVQGSAVRIVLRAKSADAARAIHVAAELPPGELRKIVGFVFGGADGSGAPEYKI